MISKKRMDKLIPQAIDVIKGMPDFFTQEKQGENWVKTNKISKTYHGYFSSFGADIVNSTPLAAIIFFEQQDTGSKEKRELIPKSILALLKKENTAITAGKLSEYWSSASANASSPAKKAAAVVAAAAALKIALRTFPQL
jgi:hypothetical protein